MAYRIRHANNNKAFRQFYPSDSTGGNIQTTDIGKRLMTLSSAKVSLLQGTSLAPTVPIAGILAGFTGGATGTSANSTIGVLIESIFTGDVLEIDWSTAYSDSTVDFQATTNIGYYWNNCSSNGIAGGGSSVAGNSVLGGLLNISTAAKVADTSHWLILQGWSTAEKASYVTIPSSNLL